MDIQKVHNTQELGITELTRPHKDEHSPPLSNTGYCVNYGTKLLASNFYTRGLWSPFVAWLRLTRSPFRFDAIEWGISRNILRQELKRAFVWASLWTGFEIILFYMFLHGASAWYGAVFVWVVLLQWIVFPYFAVRGVFERLETCNARESELKSNCLVLSETESPISDLGYLLREAAFSVDSTKRVDSFENVNDTETLTSPNSEEFYSEIERAFADASNGIRTQRLTIISSKDIQPALSDWKRWLRSDISLANNVASAGLPRLLVLGGNSKMDGLAVVEFTARIIDPHVSFRIKMRWLPGFKKRLSHLGLLRKQKLWWRGLFVPIALAVMIIAIWLALGFALLCMDPDLANTRTTLSNILNAKTTLTENSANLTALMNMTPDTFLAVLFSRGCIAPLVWLAVLLAFHSPIFLLVAFILRLGRFLKGIFYSATGTYMPVNTKDSLRYALTGSGLDQEESLQVAISYLQIVEQVLTNRIVDVLKKHNINTDAIRDELKLFVNEGIYMTGGEFRASNVLVGKGGILGFRRRRAAKRGQKVISGRFNVVK